MIILRSGAQNLVLIGSVVGSIFVCGLSHSQDKFVDPGALSVTGTGGGGVIFDLNLTTAVSGKFVVVDFPLNRSLRSWTFVSPRQKITFSWDGTDERGKPVLPGEYLIIGLLDTGQYRDCIIKRFPYSARRSSVKTSNNKSNLIMLMNSSSRSAESGGTFDLHYVLSRPAKIRSFLTDGAGVSIRELLLERNDSTLPFGNDRLFVKCVDASGEPLPIGHYRVQLTAFTPDQMETRQLEFDVITSQYELGGSASNGGIGIGGSGAGPNAQGSGGVNSGGVSGSSGGPQDTGGDGKTNNGVRDHGKGEGRDGAGQGKGQGKVK